MNVIGIDIGGTKIKGILVDRNGVILDKFTSKTNMAEGKQTILDSLFKVIDTIFQRNRDINGIGIGTAGRVNVRSGEIIYATSNLLGWTGTNIKKIAQERYAKKVVVDNDANVALIGESWIGAGKDYDNITLLTLGTGVGGANMINGDIYHGAHWSGGEWGHVNLVPDGIPCNCGKIGCVEQYLSGTALIREANKYSHKDYISGQEVFVDSLQKENLMKEVVDQYIKYLTLTIDKIKTSIDPELVIIGGGVIGSKDSWWNLLKEERQRWGIKTTVVPASLGNDAGAIGAAKLILNQLKEFNK